MPQTGGEASANTGGMGATAGAPDADPRWNAVIAKLRDDSPAWGAMYEHGIAEHIDAKRLSLVFPEGSFFGQQAQMPPAREALMEAVEAVLGAKPEVEFRFADQVAGTSYADAKKAETSTRHAEIKQEAKNHPRVRQAMEVFPELGRRVDVQIEE
jgi:hypothetical protein